MRILPPMWARTLWPPGISTRNIALGRVSITEPSTSMTSSFPADFPFAMSTSCPARNATLPPCQAQGLRRAQRSSAVLPALTEWMVQRLAEAERDPPEQTPNYNSAAITSLHRPLHHNGL